MVKVTPEEFELWTGLIYELTGIVLTANKTYLVENRLNDLLAETGSPSFKDLYFKCRYADAVGLREKVISRISTQETSFFRDPHVYSALRNLFKNEIIPVKRQTGQKAGAPPRIRIWSAACSHGQEPYSLAMVLSEAIPDVDSWDIQILATDIADNAFRKASLGRYTDLEVRRGLDQYHLNKYFVQKDTNQWQVSDQIRAMMSFRKFNLVSQPFSGLGVFDLILCRNVAIYFDHDTKKKLFENLIKVLASDGRLLVGATENLTQITTMVKPINRYSAAYYVKTGSETGQEKTASAFSASKPAGQSFFTRPGTTTQTGTNPRKPLFPKK